MASVARHRRIPVRRTHRGRSLLLTAGLMTAGMMLGSGMSAADTAVSSTESMPVVDQATPDQLPTTWPIMTGQDDAPIPAVQPSDSTNGTRIG
jgi:hypothetical protein